MGDRWTVREFHVYEDPGCAGDPLQVDTVFSEPDSSSKNSVVDGDGDSYWQADCDNCAAYGPYVGFSTATQATGQCIKLYSRPRSHPMMSDPPQP